MTKKQNKVSNVHGEEYSAKANDFQALVEAKAKGLVEYLKQSPVARLVPTLRVTEHGIIPDVRLSLVESTETKDDNSTGDEGAGEADGGEGSDTAPTTEPTPTQTA